MTGPVSERRIITVLAADIVGSTRHIAACDPDDAQTFFDASFEHLRRAVERMGGTLVSYEGDGGIAAFGWPGPLEDHADRACAAAWDIQCVPADRVGPDGRPVKFRVGVHSGLVALRQLRRGGGLRFDTVGATVHIAAKLQQSAPAGGILVSAQTVKLCRSRLAIADQSQSLMLGEAETEAFRLEARPQELGKSDLAQRYRLPMVGRDAEFAALRSALPHRDGRNRSIALLGEAGIGKSRLAAAAVGEAPALGAKVLVFFGDAQKRTTPFAAARALISDLMRLSDAISRTDLNRAVTSLALEETEVAALEALLTVTRARRDRAKLTQTQLARALANVFAALALDRPTVLLVEDLHLVDAESRQFLRLLAAAKTRHPLCLLVTGRPEATTEAHEIASTVLRLDGLPREAMQELGLHLWPDGRAPGEMLDRMIKRADGVPFVLEELVRSVENKDAASFDGLPHGVESVIHARLQRLSPSARSAAQALSLLGENVDVELAAAVLAIDAEALVDDLAELERFAFIHPMAGCATHMRHQIISEACADTIPRERRRQLHRTAVEAITSRYPDLGSRYEQLAFHAEGAGDDLPALGYLWDAGLEARRNSATASLNLIFDRAIGLIDRIGEAAEEKYVDFVLMAFASLVQLGEFDKVNRHLPRVMDLVRRFERPELISSTLSQLGMICWFEGRYGEGLEATREGLALARTLGSPALVFSNQIMLANLLHGQGRVQEAIAQESELCDLLSGELHTARLGAAVIPSSMALSFMSWFMMDVGRYAEGLEFAERGFAIAVRERDAYSEVIARSGLGRNLLMLHRNEDAADCVAVALELSERNGYDAIKANLSGRIAMALSRIGRPREGVMIVEDCMRRELHRRTGQFEVYSLYAGYAEALVGSGDKEAGFAWLETALGIARRIDNPCLIVDGLGLRARLLAECSPGNPQIAADLEEQAGLCAHYGLAAWSPVKSVTAQRPE